MSVRDHTPEPVQSEDALADLATLRSSDPAARHAMHAIKLTRLTLETFGVSRPTLADDTRSGTAGSSRPVRNPTTRATPRDPE